MINETIMFLTGMIMGATIGAFIVASLNLASKTDFDNFLIGKLLKIYNLVNNTGVYNEELIEEIKDIIEEVEDENS